MAAELDIPAWKANETCWVLERFFYGKGQVNNRVSRRSLDAFKRLLEVGATHRQAREVMRVYVLESYRMPPAERWQV